MFLYTQAIGAASASADLIDSTLTQQISIAFIDVLLVKYITLNAQTIQSGTRSCEVVIGQNGKLLINSAKLKSNPEFNG